MGVTPDRFPGPREEEEVQFATNAGDPAVGGMRYDGSHHKAQDSDGVFFLRSGANVSKNPYVGVYNSIFTMPTVAGYSHYVPWDSTEFESQSSMHDPTISDSGTATGTQTSTTLQDTSKSWTTNQYANYTVQITGGTGSGQWRNIVSNTSNTLTVAAWGTTPDATSTYRITQYSSRLIAPVAGAYCITAHASISYHAGVLGLALYVGGTFKAVHYGHQAQNIEFHAGITRLLHLAQNDYVELKIYNGGGSVQNIFAGVYRTWLQMMRVG